jgi:uncharacterized membrane protein (GlpM family)
VQQVQVVASLVLKQPVQQLLVQVVALVQTRQRVSLAGLVPVPPEWKSLLRTHRLIQDEHQLEQLYRQQHQLQVEFQQLVKEFQYQPCQ